MSGVTVGALCAEVAGTLRRAAFPVPELEAALLVGHVLGLSRTGLVLAAGEPVASGDAARLNGLLQRRLGHEPIQYILGEWEFWSRPFFVSPATLVPRPETEVLVSRVLEVSRLLPAGPVLDLGTGSGVLAVTLALELPDRMVVAVDRSVDALLLARANCRRHGVADRVLLAASDWCAGLGRRALFALVVANPPYVATADIDTLAPELSRHEPRAALDGGVDGLEDFRRIIRQLDAHLAPGGFFFTEIGAGQAPAVTALLAQVRDGDGERAFADIAVHPDYSGHERVLVARKRHGPIF